jgi:hypothetical protein
VGKRGTGLERAVAAFDAVFATLPPGNKRALALAIYRVWPAMQQYNADVAGLFTPRTVEALWGVVLSLIPVAVRGPTHALGKLGDAMLARAPHLQHFAAVVLRACEGPSAPPPLPLTTEEEHAQVSIAGRLPEPPS